MSAVSSDFRIKSVVLGEPLLDPSLLQKSLHEGGIDVSVVHHSATVEGYLVWCRDHMVARPGKPHLMGFNNFGMEIIQATSLAPPYCLSQKEQNRCNSLGSGVFPDQGEIEKVLSFMQQHKIPYQKSHCAFDGGNIYLFNDQTGKPRAIIGFNTVVHTYVALKIQKFYEQHQERLQIEVEPSEEAYYAARNLEVRKKYGSLEEYLYQQYDPNHRANQETINKNGELLGRYKDELFAPVTKDEKTQLYTQAVEIEKRYRIAQEELGKELGVNDPIFVPQRHYHIDMDLLPLNDKNVVFYHRDHDPNYAHYVNKIEIVLQSHGLIPKPIFGLSNATPKFNLMNALQIKDVLVFPKINARHCKIDERFMEMIKKEGVKVCRITLERDLYTLFEGGLRCCTMIIYEKKDKVE